MRMALILLAGAFSAFANDSFIDQLETRTSRFSVLNQAILFDIHDADNEQVKAFSVYARESSKHMTEFAALLARANVIIDAMGSKPSNQQLEELRGLAGKMDAVIDELRKTREQVTQITK